MGARRSTRASRDEAGGNDGLYPVHVLTEPERRDLHMKPGLVALFEDMTHESGEGGAGSASVSYSAK